MPFQQKPATLRPLPTRVTQRQYDRLMQHRDKDHLSIQEHVRRALDIYLEQLDKRWEREIALSGSQPNRLSPPSGAVKPNPRPGEQQQKSPMLPQKPNVQSSQSAPKLSYR